MIAADALPRINTEQPTTYIQKTSRTTNQRPLRLGKRNHLSASTTRMIRDRSKKTSNGRIVNQRSPVATFSSPSRHQTASASTESNFSILRHHRGINTLHSHSLFALTRASSTYLPLCMLDAQLNHRVAQASLLWANVDGALQSQFPALCGWRD